MMFPLSFDESIHTRTVKIAEQLNELWDYADSVHKEELSDRAPITYQDISSNKISDLTGQIDTALSNQDIDPKIKSKLKRVKKAWTEQLKRNEDNSAKMGFMQLVALYLAIRYTNCLLIRGETFFCHNINYYYKIKLPKNRIFRKNSRKYKSKKSCLNFTYVTLRQPLVL